MVIIFIGIITCRRVDKKSVIENIKMCNCQYQKGEVIKSGLSQVGDEF